MSHLGVGKFYYLDCTQSLSKGVVNRANHTRARETAFREETRREEGSGGQFSRVFARLPRFIIPRKYKGVLVVCLLTNATYTYCQYYYHPASRAFLSGKSFSMYIVICVSNISRTCSWLVSRPREKLFRGC